MNFLNEKHKERFQELMRRGDISINDMERVPGMYILSGTDDLFRKANDIYDFEKGWFKVDIKCCEECNSREVEWEKASLSSSQEKLATLAFDIYSARSHVGVCELFRILDQDNVKLAMNAISMKYLR